MHPSVVPSAESPVDPPTESSVGPSAESSVDPSFDRAADEEAVDEAYATLERLRWDGPPRCPHCGSGSVAFLRPVGGRRTTRTGAVTARRVWRCATCHRQFSALTRTVLHGTRIDLRVWLAVIDDWAGAGAVPDPARIVREHGISRDAARHLHRILVRCSAVAEVADRLPADPSPADRAQPERQGSARFSGGV